MIIIRKDIKKSCVLDAVIGSEKDLKLFSLDRRNNVIELEARGGSLAKFETRYELLYEDEPDKLKDIEQFFIVKVNPKDFKDMKISVLTCDNQGNVIHTEKLEKVYIGVQEKLVIKRFLEHNDLLLPSDDIIIEDRR